MMRKFVSVLLAVLVLMAAVGAFAEVAPAEGAAPAPAENAEGEAAAPMDSAVGAFSTEDLEGNAVDSNVFARSKLTLVNVWATYCPPCVAEIPDLAKLDKEIDGFQVLGILIDAGVKGFPEEDNLDLGKEILAKSGVEYVSVLPDLELINKLLVGVYAVPTSVFVDENGQKVGGDVVGSKDYDGWKAEIEKRLAQVQAG